MQVTAMEEENALEVNEREIWLQDDQDDLLGVNDASMFYADFPPLPDFSCMSSSSSSSSAPALPVKTLTTSSSLSSTATSSSSSAASWAVLKSDAEDNIPVEDAPSLPPPPPPSLATLSFTASTDIPLPLEHDGLPTVTAEDCMATLKEPFPYMEMLEINDFFDPALIFQEEDYPLEELEYPQDHQTHHQEEYVITVQQQAEDQHQHQVVTSNNEEEKAQIQLGSEDGMRSPDCEMSDVFLEWLKSNRDSISANDLRSVKLKKSTIECAAKRLGGGKEAMKQLLKLILEWVQTSHLQNRRRNNKENDNNNNNSNISNSSAPSNFVTNPSTNSNPNSFGPWISQPPPPYGIDPAAIVAAPPPPNFPVIGYRSDPYSNGAPNSITLYQPGTEYNMLESAHSWPPSQLAIAPHYNQSFGDNNLPRGNPPVNPAFGGYGNQYPYQYFHGPAGDKMMRLGPSATKEARKKRMARQKRYLSHSHHRSQKHHGQVQNHSGDHDPLARLGTDHNCTAGVVNPANWMYWASLAGGRASVGPPVIPAEPQAGQPGLDRTVLQTQNYHQGSRGVSSTDHRRQGWKPEKNLRFLLQKVLKQSDVGSLGRIVLPKKEAETHLPELEARDGISIAMEDIGTSRVWNMRYRYWPNNKSRMYLLENTGDFVKANGLQEGDFIVLYSDVKCGKFLIRGVKVRQAAYGAKTAETKKAAGKSQKTLGNANIDSPSPSSPQKKMRK